MSNNTPPSTFQHQTTQMTLLFHFFSFLLFLFFSFLCLWVLPAAALTAGACNPVAGGSNPKPITPNLLSQGPPVGYEIPRAFPIDIDQIPTAAPVSSASLLHNLSLPIIQPIAKSNQSKKGFLIQMELEALVSWVLEVSHPETDSAVTRYCPFSGITPNGFVSGSCMPASRKVTHPPERANLTSEFLSPPKPPPPQNASC